MNQYRIDVISDAEPDRPAHIAYFDADSHDTAITTARQIVCAHITDPDTQYGSLWVRNLAAIGQAEHVEVIEVAA